jgi:hypothetical protein
MPGINILVPYELAEEEAVKRIKNELTGLKTHFADTISDLHENWNANTCEFSLSVKGLSGSGTMNVKPREVEMAVNLPFFAVPFKGKIEATVRERLKQLLV